MSFEVTPVAYRTKLGNLTAKSVLALIAEQANADGLGWPSLTYIADRTEVNLRTVFRVIQVFVEIGLIRRTQIDRSGRKLQALQLDLEKLGGDLRAEFAAAYGRAQNKRQSAQEECLCDSSAGVAETAPTVAATVKSVAETVPPDPLLGGTVSDPLGTSPVAPKGGLDAEDSACEDVDLTEEQLAHVAKARERGEDASMWERYYRKENREQQAADREEREKGAALERLKAQLVNVKAAREWIKQRCGIVADRAGRGIDAVLDAVLEQQLASGVELWESAPKMADAWRAYGEMGDVLKVVYGVKNFFREGVWMRSRTWVVDEEKRRRLARF